MTQPTDRELALECLKHLSPLRAASYETWLAVGMALHEAGCSFQDWTQWHPDGNPSHDRVCFQKWSGFGSYTGPKSTVGTLVKWARDDDPAFRPTDAGRDAQVVPIGWDDPIPAHFSELPGNRAQRPVATSEAAKPPDISLDQIVPETVPEPAADWPSGDLVRYLEALYRPEDIVSYVLDAFEDADGAWKPGSRGIYTRTAADLIAAAKKHAADLSYAIGDWNPAAGAWCRLNPMDGNGVRNDNVRDMRHVLVESDTMPIEKQFAVIQALQLPCSAVVHSGGKSLHAIVRVDAAQDLKVYRERIDFLFAVLARNGFVVDKQCRNPARLSRMPGITRNGRKQYLVSGPCGSPSWAAWEAVQKGGKLDTPIDVSTWLGTDPDPADPILRATLDKGDKLVLIAPSKQRKSFFFLQLMMSIASGRPFLAWTPERPMSVLLVQFEVRGNHFHSRAKAIAAAMGVSSADLGGRLFILNCRGRDMDEVYRAVEAHCQAHPTDLIAFDPFYKMHSGDENSSEDIKPLLRKFDALCEASGAAVAYVHHDPKGNVRERNLRDRGAGSSVVARDYDCCFAITPDEDREDVCQIDVLTRNYPPQPAVHAQWRDGIFRELTGKPAASIESEGNPWAKSKYAGMGFEYMAPCSHNADFQRSELLVFLQKTLAEHGAPVDLKGAESARRAMCKVGLIVFSKGLWKGALA